jgi:hypothetical protein
MKKLLALILLCSCASAQQTEEGVKKAECVLQAMAPVREYFTKEQLEMVFSGELDVKETLQAIDISPKEVLEIAENVESCFKG